MKRFRTLALAIGLFGLATSGCAGMTFDKALSDLRSGISLAQLVITAIQTFGDAKLTGADKAAFDTKVAQAEAAAAAALSAANGASDISDGHVAQAFNDFEDTYSSLVALGQSLGIKISATSSKPGAEVAGDVLVVPPATVLRPAGVRPRPATSGAQAVSSGEPSAVFQVAEQGGSAFGVTATPLDLRELGGAAPASRAAGSAPGGSESASPANPALSGDIVSISESPSPFLAVLSLELSDPPLLTVVDRPGPSTCPAGMHDGTVFAPGAVCVRDGLKWSSVLARLRSECERQGGCTAEYGGPWVQAIFDVSGARIQHAVAVR